MASLDRLLLNPGKGSQTRLRTRMYLIKSDAITRAGIEVVGRVNIPAELIPEDAQVEMDAKMAARA